MRVWKYMIAWALLAVIFASAGIVQGQPNPQEQQLREWIKARLDRQYDGFPNGKGIIVEYTQTRSTWLSRAEVNERWKKVEKYLDHPDRLTTRMLREFFKQPTLAKGRIAYADRGRAWRYDYVIEESAAEVAGYETHVGGRGDIRWMGKSTSLLIIHEGVPFPASSNTGVILDSCRQQLSLIFYGGLPRLLPNAMIESVSLSGSDWQVMLRWDDADYKKLVEGGIDPRGKPFVETITHIGAKNEADRRIELRFERYQYDELVDLGYPARIVEDRSDGIRETYVIDSLQIVNEQRVEEEGNLPSVAPDARIRNFSQGNTDVWASLPDMPRMVWTHQDGHDFYRRVEEDNKPMTSGVATASSEGVKKNDSAELRGGEAGAVHNGSGWLRILAIAATIIVVVGLPVAIHLIRRR